MPNKRPPSIMGDDERATIGGAKTPPLGVPVEISGDDSNKTPPPMDPFDITQLPAYQKLDPEMRELVLALHNTDREQDVALSRVWPARNVHEVLISMNQRIAVVTERTKGLDELKNSVVSLGGVMARFTAIVEEREKRDKRIESMLETQGSRIGIVETSTQVQASALEDLKGRVGAGDAVAMREVEDLTGEMKLVKARVGSLEETRTKLRGAWIVIAAVASVLAAVVAFLLTQVWQRLAGTGAK